jgi:hypothetical protein
MAVHKYDKNLRARPGFTANPDDVKRARMEAEERRAKKLAKEAAKRLRAEGFEFDKFVKHVGRFGK